jgi:hypothetical protein
VTCGDFWRFRCDFPTDACGPPLADSTPLTATLSAVEGSLSFACAAVSGRTGVADRKEVKCKPWQLEDFCVHRMVAGKQKRPPELPGGLVNVDERLATNSV